MIAELDECAALTDLCEQLVALKKIICSESCRLMAENTEVDDMSEPSASLCNLANYLALREQDLRPLQEQLAHFSLSSLGRSEAHVMETLETLIRLLSRAVNRAVPSMGATPVSLREGEQLLARHIEQVLGPKPDSPIHLMVTLPREAAENHALIDALLLAGTSCVRINCAHDDVAIWEAMIKGVRAAEQRHGRTCRIQMDLSGPKLRTGHLMQCASNIELRGHKALGASLDAPDLVLITDKRERLECHSGQGLLMEQEDFALFNIGDQLLFQDCRGKKRHLEIIEKVDGAGYWCVCKRNAVIDLNTEFTLLKQGENKVRKHRIHCLRFVQLTVPLRLFKGDIFLLCNGSEPLNSQNNVPSISIQVPEILERLVAGTRIWFDDGKLGGHVQKSSAEGVMILIDHAPPKGAKLGPDKGINVPGVDLGLSALSSKDLEDLDFVVAYADLVALSFTERLEDVERLISEMRKRGDELPVILKIETERGIANLPTILLASMDKYHLGVMIARGDLAVEVGGARMAELQEELLWLCEAAHLPVIWATQVLETLVKEGGLSRPEMTDAAVSGRADCVMLNKGPYIVEGVHTLCDVLGRMQNHQHKKTPRMCSLHWSEVS